MDNVNIRGWQISDGSALSEALNNRRVLDWLRDGLPFPYTKNNAEEYINYAMSADKNKALLYAIEYGGQVVGNIGAIRCGNIHFCAAELGYYINERFWGRGIATAAVKLVCEKLFAETDILRIFAEPFSDNFASRRVLEKSGFVLEGILKNNAVKNGIVWDMAMYAKIKEEQK